MKKLINKLSKLFFFGTTTSYLSPLYKDLVVISNAVQRITDEDPYWQRPNISDAGYDVKILEVGSTGIHEGYCDASGDYWICDDDDVWGSNPFLIKKLGRTGQPE